MQYIPCNSALLAQETLFLTQKGTFLPKDLQKVRKSRQILICDKIAYFRPSPNFSAGAPGPTFILRWSCLEFNCQWNSVLRDQPHCGSLVEKPCCRETEEKADLAPLGIMSVVQSGKPRHLRLQDNPPNNTLAQPAKSCTRRDVVFFSTANVSIWNDRNLSKHEKRWFLNPIILLPIPLVCVQIVFNQSPTLV